MIRRWVFNFAAALSLLMCVASAVFWFRGYRASDYLSFAQIAKSATNSNYDKYMLSSEQGAIGVGVVRATVPNTLPQSLPVGWQFESGAAADFRPQTTLERLGFWHVRSQVNAFGILSSTSADSVPGYLLVLLFGIMPVVRGYKFLYRIKPKGRCRSCGYSLTGNTSGTCPECGTPVPSSKQTI